MIAWIQAKVDLIELYGNHVEKTNFVLDSPSYRGKINGSANIKKTFLHSREWQKFPQFVADLRKG